MCACERAFIRGQPPAGKFYSPTKQLEIVQRCPNGRHGVSDECNPIRALCGKRGANRNGIDMDPVDDETGCQSMLRKCGADDPGARALSGGMALNKWVTPV